MDVSNASSNICLLDLVSFGKGLGNRGLIYPDTEPLPVGTFPLLRFDGSIVTKTAREIKVVGRSHLYPGMAVGSTSDLGGQMGVVTGVTTVVDLVKLDGRGELTEVVRGVSPRDLRRVRRLNIGDFVVSGPWLGRVVEASVDVDVLFEQDGSVCRVADAKPETLNILAATHVHYRPMMNVAFYPGQLVIGDPRAVFKASRWLRGCWKPGREVGLVAKVDVSGVLVSWIASKMHGAGFLVQASAPPADYMQNPDDLTLLCAALDCSWGVADRCYLRAPAASSDHGPAASSPCFAHRRHLQEAPQTHGTCPDEQQDSEPSALAHHVDVVPLRAKTKRLYYLGKQLSCKVFCNGRRHSRRRTRRRETIRRPRSYPEPEPELPMIVASTRTSVDVLWQDGTLQRGTPSASVVECENGHEFFPGQHVIDNSSAPHVDGAESTGRVGVVRSMDYKDQTVRVSWFKAASACPEDVTVSAYDLETGPDRPAYYGDVVVRRLLPSGSTDDGSSRVEPPVSAEDLSWVGRVVDLVDDGHAVRVRWGDGSMSTVLHHEISVVHKQSDAWVAMGDWVEDDGIDAPEEPVATNADNDPPNLADAATEAITAAATRNDAGDNVGGQDSAEEGKKALDTICDDGLFRFAQFDVIKSPPDHHYFDTTNKGGSSGKNWAKTVHKEWQILQNHIPETIYVRAYEDRMDLLRVAIVGASGTPYHDGLFFFDLQLPPSYPAVPPQVYYHSFGLSLNPNLYASGTVCLSLLDTFGGGEDTEVWLPTTSSLLQVVVSIQGLVLTDQPYYNEAGHETLMGTPEGHRKALPYNENAYLLTLRTALQLLRRPPRGFEGFVRDHFRSKGRFMLRACKEYLGACVVATLGSMAERPCSAGLRLALANLVPSLAAAFKEIGAEGCSEFQQL